MDGEFNTNKIAAEVVTDLAKSAAKSLYNKLSSYFSDMQKKEEIDFGYAFENYLLYAKGVHEKIKTLLYRHAAKPIYSFYECAGLRRGGVEIDTSDIRQVLDVGKNVIIAGSGGIGKSVMMKHFFLNTIQNTNYIPVIVELRGLNEFEEKDLNIIDYVYHVMETLKFKMEKRYFEYSLETGCYIILLDGFDEVKNALSTKAAKEILELSKKYPDNHYIVSSRPLDEFTGWEQFEELWCMPLSKEQALSLINKLDYDPKIKKSFYKELDETLFDKYKTFASNPLLLTIMLLTYENRVSIPDKLNDFYEQAFTTLFHAHDASKGGYKRDIQSKLGYEDFKAVFAYFCFKSFFKSDFKFTENKALEYISLAKNKNIIQASFDSLDYLKDLTNSVCMLVHEGLDYRFSHRSFQEYFAALYTTQLDDAQQKKFLKLWMEGENFITNSFLDMLYALQPTRFVKNVLVPGVLELRDLYQKNGQSTEWLLQFLFEGVCVIDKGKDRMGVIIQEEYFTEMMNRTCSIGGLFKNKVDKDEECTLCALLKEKYGYNSISFSELKQEGLWDELLNGLLWPMENFEFAVHYIEELEKDSISRKKKFSSILDEL